jgi:hypothetical protein
MSIKDRILKDCVSRLDALGLDYAIIDFKGKTIGTLVVSEKEARAPRQIPWEDLYHFSDILKSSNIGDVYEFKPLEGHSLNSLQSQVASAAVRLVGKGNYATCRNNAKNTIEFMRIK